MNQVPNDMKHEMSVESTKAIPAIAGATVAGLTLNEVVAVVTILYVILQIAFLIWKWRRQHIMDKEKREALDKVTK